MKTMALLFLLVALTLIASAQSPDRDQPAPPITIHHVRVTEYSVTFRGNSGPHAPYHDRFNGPETRRYYAESGVATGPVNYASQPEDFKENEREFLAHMESRKPPASTFPAKISFCAAVKNTSTKPIKVLRLQFVFSNPATGAQFPPYEQRVKVKIKPGEEMWLNSVASVPKAPGDLVRAMLSGQVNSDVQLLRVEYADGSVWNRP